MVRDAGRSRRAPRRSGNPCTLSVVVEASDRPSGMATASFVVSLCGLVGLICLGVGGIAGLVGAVLGHVARADARRDGLGPPRLAVWGVLLGWTGFVVGVAVLTAISVYLAASPELTDPAVATCWFFPCD